MLSTKSVFLPETLSAYLISKSSAVALVVVNPARPPLIFVRFFNLIVLNVFSVPSKSKASVGRDKFPSASFAL